MKEWDNIHLEDVIDIDEMKKILNSFILATGLGAICVNDKGESAIVPEEHEAYCSFCKIIRSDPEGRRRCADSMNKAGKLAAKLGEPYISRCHAGLIEFAAPILFNDIYLGSISCGPVLMWEWDEIAIQEFLNLTADLNINREALLAASREIKVLTGRNVQAAAELLYITANHFAKSSIITLQQRKELSEQQSRLAEMIFEHKKAEERIRLLEERVKCEDYPMDKENELLSNVRMGDRTGAKKILNELLAVIFLRSSGNIELIKARVLELVIVISRAAVEGGASLDKLLGLNYSFISELAEKNRFEDICSWIVKVLDTFLDTVYESRNIKNSALLGEAVRYIRENYNENLSLEDVAQKVFISPYYLSHLFREELGITFLEYLTRIRIEEAKKLLQDRSLTIFDISARVGYEDPGYFSKVFKKNMGVSPNQYRKNTAQG
ncbi:MAG: PocR ligand-binding domain-containing protein [Caldicoprobacterales bacterium]|jgi:two-component system response regulator YesN|nr:AraC family transcriptional regulator [Clostridiales bacterium]